MTYQPQAQADAPYIDPSRTPGTGLIARSLALTTFTLVVVLSAAGLIFWNAILPFYGLLYLWGGQ